MNYKEEHTPESLDELRAAMQTLRKSFPESPIVSDTALRKAMRSKSLWMKQMVISEFIILPIMTAVFVALSVLTGVSIWVAVSFAIFGTVDAILDIRTLAISKDWIQNDSIVELSRHLIRQKKERRTQTIIATALMVVWILWFLYEFMSHCAVNVPEESFALVYAVNASVAILVSLIVICIIYFKAQSTNDSLLRQLDSFIGE